jgi:hypothetical protein
MVRFPADNNIKLQLQKLGYKKTKSGNLSIHAKEGFHDDIPDAMALAVWALPNTGGTGNPGAQGMVEPMTIGRMTTDSNGNRKYTFGDGDDDDDLPRTFVGSTRMSR